MTTTTRCAFCFQPMDAGDSRCPACGLLQPAEGSEPARGKVQLPGPDSPAGWYRLEGGGRRYWDGQAWAGDPQPPKFGDHEDSKPGLIAMAIVGSLLLSPLLGIIMGAIRLRKNGRDGAIMIAGGVVIWLVAAALVWYFIVGTVTVDSTAVEDEIALQFDEQLGLTGVTSVECPEDPRVRVGGTMDCTTAQGDNIEVTIDDRDGGFTWVVK